MRKKDTDSPKTETETEHWDWTGRDSPYKSAAIQDSFGHKGAVFLGVRHCTESLLSVKIQQLNSELSYMKHS